MREIIKATALGAAVGLAVGLLGEVAVFATLQLFPTDVAIVGFAVYLSVPFGAAVGALCGWRGWVPNPQRRALAAAAPGVLVGIAAVVIQRSAV